ncbi:uncharacterized protein BCR38DRAFT_338302 [Pseudomassariella vexata]|uniref:FAD-binding domain-containing protein n=1 Tax=Pseudomassariella vexata TaxID=1141098 RepID=A0A1Y2E7M4_9PEZI|nr:uncharacterized protein BCR38DRAFT_338302 [Pseudomassariella vexata]ORY67561.1 hypothetical protein BCR38DRAFT_338302 [Pseudomassariella vexata]
MGGGIAGAALLRGLLQYPHLVVDMYESRPSFREEGPGISLSPSTELALQAINPALEVCLNRAGAVYGPMELRVASGSHTGRKVDIASLGTPSKKSVDNDAFLAQMLSGVSRRMLHTNTRLSSIQKTTEGDILLTFDDGTQKVYDVVVGADGVHGMVRSHVVGPNDPAGYPTPSGIWGLPIKVPIARARQMMGSHFLDPQNPRQVVWLGEGTMMQHDILSNGREVQIVLYAMIGDTEEEFSWARLFTPEEMEQMFCGSTPQACRGMVRLVQSHYTVQVAGMCQMQHVHTPTYASSNACLIGEAAHTLFPMQNIGTNLALEQALIISTMLGRTMSKAEIPAALQAFDQVCRPRAEAVAQDTFELADVLTGRDPGAGLDPVLIGERLGWKWSYMHNGFDVEAARAEAWEAMNQGLGMGGTW